MKRVMLLIILTIVLSVPASAQQMVLSIAASYGAFSPSSGATRSTYGSTWRNVSIGYFVPELSNKWTPAADFTIFSHSHVGSANLYPTTYGIQRGFGGAGSLQPYLALRVGPYYGRAKVASQGIDEAHIGADANVAVGVIIAQRYYIEARYDYFTRFAGSSFNGLNISAGLKLFDIRL